MLLDDDLIKLCMHVTVYLGKFSVSPSPSKRKKKTILSSFTIIAITVSDFDFVGFIF